MTKKYINIDNCCNEIAISCNKITDWMTKIEENMEYMEKNIWNGGKRSEEQYQNLRGLLIKLQGLIENVEETVYKVKDTMVLHLKTHP